MSLHVEMCWYCDDGVTPASHLVWNVPGRPDGCCDAHAATCRDCGDRVTPLFLQAPQSGSRTLTEWGWVTPSTADVITDTFRGAPFGFNR